MPLLLNDVIEVTAKLTFKNVAAVRNVYHLKCTEAATGTDAAIVEDTAKYISQMYGTIESLLSNDLKPQTVHVVNLTQRRFMGEVPWTSDFTGGTSTANSYALGVAIVVRLLTGLMGVQGRKFIGVLTETIIDDDALISNAALLTMADFALMLLQRVEYTPGYASFGVWNRIKATFQVVADVAISAVPGYQRRRKQGRGI